MPSSASQTFLRELDQKLWTAADRLRSNLDLSREQEAVPDAPIPKHAVLGPIFLKSGATHGHLFSPNGATHTSLGHRPRFLSPSTSRALKGRHISRRCPAWSANPTTRRLAAMNMAIRGIDFNFGKEPANSFTQDQHPDLRADYVMALPSAAARSHPRSHPADRSAGRINPPFNIKEWWDGKLEGNARWSRSEAKSASHAKFYTNRGKYGTPPQTAMRECAPLIPEGTPQVVSEARDKNANFAWVQHATLHAKDILSHVFSSLAPPRGLGHLATARVLQLGPAAPESSFP